MQVLILGGSQWQLSLIKNIRELGYYAIVADQDKKCPGAKIADEYWNVSILDRDELLKKCKKSKINLVISDSTDRAVTEVGFLNDNLGLNGISYRIAERFTNKVIMRDMLKGKIRMPRHISLPLVKREVENAYDLIGPKTIIKPSLGQSSIGVKEIFSKADIKKLNFEKEYFGCDELIIEEFVEGVEYTVDSITIEKKTSITGVSRKTHYADNKCVASSLNFDVDENSIIFKKLSSIHNDVIRNLGLLDGICHAEYIISNDNPFLVEIAARGGGSGVSSIIVPFLNGFSHYEILVRRLIGEKVIAPKRVGKRFACLRFFDFPKGKILEVNKPEKGFLKKYVKLFNLAIQPGDVISYEIDDKKRNSLGYFIVTNKSREDLYQIVEQVIGKTNIISKND